MGREWQAQSDRDERGVHLFRVEDALRLNGGEPIESLPRARAYVATAHGADGELAAKIFDLLVEGVPPVKIVTRLRVGGDNYFCRVTTITFAGRRPS